MNTVRLGFILGDLDDLKCRAGDVVNAFLNGYTKEKICIVAGLDFDPDLAGRS